MVTRADFYAMQTVGKTVSLSGDVTTLNWIMPGAEGRTEENLGYRPGRLSEGYFVALLKERLTPEDFDFAGTTMRSGGRWGLASESSYEDDARRPRVHDTIMRERGAGGYVTLQKSALTNFQLSGPTRIVKVYPKSETLPHLSPRQEFPMGGGGLQWTIRRDRARDFLVALRVDPDGTATTPEFSVSLGAGGYDAKHRIRQYLERPDLF